MAQTTTVTITAPAPSPTTCPVCFDCNKQGCRNFGGCSGNTCQCPQGFGGQDCLTPVCNSTNVENSRRTLNTEIGKPCQQCDTGFDGLSCDACLNDAACATPNLSSETSVCNRQAKVWKASTTYCTLDVPLLTAIYPLQSKIQLFRNVTAGYTLGSLWYDDKQQFMCLINNCTQSIEIASGSTSGTYNWACTQAKCECVPGATFCGGQGVVVDLTGSIESASGGLKFSCPTSTNRTATGSSLRSLTPGEQAGIGISAALVAVILAGFAWAWFMQVKARKMPIPPMRKGGRLDLIALGAGKSTFLDIIAGKSKSGTITGRVTIDGQDLPSSAFKSLVAFVDQDDLLLSTLTKRDRVDEVIRTLGLEHVADSIVGGGGAKTRDIGWRKTESQYWGELVTSPSVLLLDEPTSGLDSYNALAVVKTLTDLAKVYGKTVIFTIHQPRSDVFTLFDDLLVLASGLCCIVDRVVRSGLRQRFSEKVKSVDKLADAENGVELVSLGEGRAPSSKKESKNSTPTSNPISPLPHSTRTPSETPTEGRVGFMTQLSALTLRSYRNLYRNLGLLLAHLVLAVVLGVFVGMLYYRSGNSLGGIQNRLGSLVFLLALLGFSGISAIGSFASDRALYVRERSAGFYGTLPLFITRLVFDTLALRIIPAFIMGTIVFALIGLSSEGDKYVKFIVVVLLFAAEIGLLCLAFAIAVPDVGTSTLVAAIVILFKMLFAESIPSFIRWIQYGSFFRFSYEALVVNDIAGIKIVDTIAGASVNIPASIILQRFGFDLNSYYRDLFVSIGLTVSLLGVVYGLLVWRLREMR
ncbi:hypothetical protein BC829DRAFT_447641 [Chytridium lagenaria]|nr:hypothetical protein BC829DRAFT_447641 [Chytridium lagenaria]